MKNFPTRNCAGSDPIYKGLAPERDPLTGHVVRLTLAYFTTFFGFVDNINATFTTNKAIISIACFQGFK